MQRSYILNNFDFIFLRGIKITQIIVQNLSILIQSVEQSIEPSGQHVHRCRQYAHSALCAFFSYLNR